MNVTILHHFDDVALSHFSFLKIEEMEEFKNEVKLKECALFRLEKDNKKATLGVVFREHSLYVNWLGGNFVYLCGNIASLLRKLAIEYKKCAIHFCGVTEKHEKLYKRHGAVKCLNQLILKV